MTGDLCHPDLARELSKFVQNTFYLFKIFKIFLYCTGEYIEKLVEKTFGKNSSMTQVGPSYFFRYLKQFTAQLSVVKAVPVLGVFTSRVMECFEIILIMY